DVALRQRQQRDGVARERRRQHGARVERQPARGRPQQRHSLHSLRTPMKTLSSALPFTLVLALAACPAATPDPIKPPPPATVTSFTVSTKTVASSGEMVTLTWA